MVEAPHGDTMSAPVYQQGLPICPICGGPMLARPSLDGSGTVAICPACPHAPVISLAKPPQADVGRDAGTARFRKLTSKPLSPPAPGSWPEALLEDLPEEARQRLRGRPPSGRAQGTAQLCEEMARALRDQGFVIAEDAHGVRISGRPVTGRGSGSGRLSASDVVRMAADLDGGVRTPDQTRRCPKCDAVVAVGEPRCPWCGGPLAHEPAS